MDFLSFVDLSLPCNLRLGVACSPTPQLFPPPLLHLKVAIRWFSPDCGWNCKGRWCQAGDERMKMV